MSLPYHRKDMAHQRGEGGNNPWGNRDQRAQETNRTLLEQENNDRWNALGDQVNLLKSLTIDINQEVKSQNSLLDGMGTNFTSAGELFSKTIGKMGVMLNSASSKHMYYLVGFVVFVFLLLYFMMGKRH
mmetsp:Transcript_23596/g.23792  ORF Transcript_23596/g.23792 Transcript_23596/m.23792 type:complete len:129 (+) Transcript_23596:77-463(+)